MQIQKLIPLAISCLLLSSLIQAQSPVSWEFSAKRVSDKEFELHIIAKIQEGWHIYSQQQPESSIGLPTSIKINPNPLIASTSNKKLLEVGDLKVRTEPELGITQNEYHGSVEFIKRLKLKAGVKTNVQGKIEYMACTNEKCLPATSVNFTVNLL